MAFKAGQCSARLWHCQKVEKAFVVFFQSCLSAVFVLIIRGKEGTIRVADGDRLSVNTKNAFNSFVGGLHVIYQQEFIS